MDWNSFDFERAVNALLLLFGGILSLFGIRQANKGSKPGGDDTHETVEIAGAIIDRKDVDRLVKGFDDNITAVNGLTKALLDQRKAIEQATESMDEMRESVRDVARDLRDVTHELVRRPRS